MSELKTNKISPATGTAVALGDSGDTFTIPAGANIVNSGTATGFGTPAAWSVKTSGSVSAVSSLNITGLTKTTQVILSNTFPSTDSQVLYSRVSRDNGSSWVTANVYRWDLQWARENSNSVNDSGSGGNGQGYIRMGLLTGNAGGENESITYTMYSPENTSRYTTMTWQGSIIESDGLSLCVSTTGSAYVSDNTNAVNGLQFYYPSGEITADYVVLELN